MDPGGALGRGGPRAVAFLQRVQTGISGTEASWTPLLWGAVGLFGVGLLVLLWSLVLRRQVRRHAWALERRGDQLKAVARLAKRLVQESGHAREVLDEVVAQVRRELEVQALALWVWEEASGSLVLWAEDPQGAFRPLGWGPVVREGEGVVGEAFQHPHPLQIHDVRQDPRFEPEAEDGRVGSVVLFPLQVRERTLGVLCAAWPVPRAFDASDVEALQIVADLLAAVLERERLWRRLQASEIQARLTLESVWEGILTVDEEGQIVAANRAASELLEVENEELIGRSIVDFLPSEVRPYIFDWIRMLRDRKGTPVTFPRRQSLVTGRGRRIPVELVHGAYTLGDRTYLTFFFRDLRERLALEERLQQTQRLESLGTLAAGIAHDFNNMLTVVVGMLDLVLRELPPEALHRDPLEMARFQAQRAADMVQQLLTFSRRAPTERRPLDLIPLVKEVVRLLERILPEEIQVVFEYPPATTLLIESDVTQVQQVLLNLATNARDAMPEGGVLTISLERVELGKAGVQQFPELVPGPYVRLSVRDTGLGIPPEIQGRIFEPFFTTKPPGQGTGLGLAVVWGIVRQHGGTVVVESQPGKGTAVHTYWPQLLQELPSEGEEGRGGILSGEGETILLVEDDPDVRASLSRILRSLGYRVLQAAQGQEALGTLQEIHVDLVLSDYHLPDRTGLELARDLGLEGLRLPFLLITGYELEEPPDAPLVTDVLRKPVDVERLSQAIRRALDRSKDGSPT